MRFPLNILLYLWQQNCDMFATFIELVIIL